MEKPAETAYPIHELLRRRWSPRAFSNRPVERAVLLSLFEAARWAPSSNNEQPWSFVMATRDDEAGYRRLFDCLKEGNKKWAFTAPVLALSVARFTFEDDGTPNPHSFAMSIPIPSGTEGRLSEPAQRSLIKPHLLTGMENEWKTERSFLFGRRCDRQSGRAVRGAAVEWEGGIG